MMNVDSINFTNRYGKDYAHAAREAQNNKNYRAMEKQVKANKAKIDSMVAKLQSPEISNVEKKSLLGKINKLLDNNDRMQEIIDSHR